ncbi:Primosomal protein I [Vibrio cholerae]|nr:Primosomal protein I [Vibrio cholerae]
MKLKFTETNESHAFSVSDAMKYGAEAAAILNTIRYWLRKNFSDGRNIKNGYVWTYHTAENLHKALPYLDERKCLRLLSKLKTAGAIIVDTLSENRWDRTRWYTLPEFEIEMETDIDAENGENIDNLELSDCFSAISKIDTSNINNLRIDDQKLTHVTDLKTDLNTDLNTNLRSIQPQASGIDPSISSVLIEDSFEKIFWPQWEGRKIARGECLALFRSLVERKQVCPHEFATMLAQDIKRRREGGQQGFDKMHPKSYLKGRRWEDQVFAAQVPVNQESSNSLELKKLKQEIRELQIAINSERSYRDSLKPNQPNYDTLLESSRNKIALYDAKKHELMERLKRMEDDGKTPQNRF